MEKRHPKEALRYFTGLNAREHAVFEAGIALGAIAHQLSGLPVKAEEDFLRKLARSLEESFKSQPFRQEVRIEFNLERVRRLASPIYGYGVLTPDCLDIRVKVEYDGSKAVGRMRYVEELGYPLMYIESVE